MLRYYRSLENFCFFSKLLETQPWNTICTLQRVRGFTDRTTLFLSNTKTKDIIREPVALKRSISILKPRESNSWEKISRKFESLFLCHHWSFFGNWMPAIVTLRRSSLIIFHWHPTFLDPILLESRVVDVKFNEKPIASSFLTSLRPYVFFETYLLLLS